MTLALFLTQPGELAHVSVGTTYVLAGPEGRHAATVKRVRPGERLYVADGAGRRLTGTVAAAEASQVRLAVEDVVDEPPPLPVVVEEVVNSLGVPLLLQAKTHSGAARTTAERASVAR